MTRRTELALIAAVSVVGFIVVWLLSDGIFLNPVMAALALGGAGLAAALLPRHPGAAVGVVFVLSSFSRLSIGLPIGRMRMEQPGIAALVIGLVLHRRELNLPSLRPIAAVIVAGAVYLVVSAASSALNSPDVGESMRFLLWTAVSMIGGLAAYLLVGAARSHAQVMSWFAADGALMAVLGLVVAVAFYLYGPGVPGIFGELRSSPKVLALAHEANLYASLISATAFFAIERFRERRTLMWALAVAVTLGGIGVGITRGAYIGLAVGILVYAFVIWRSRANRPLLMRIVAFSLVVTLVGMVIGAILMDVAVRDRHLVARGEPVPSFGEPDDLSTLEYRLARLGPAFDDWLTSPFIGTGLASFDGLHPLEEEFELNYINIMAVMTLHDSGLIGLIALSALFGLILIRLWRASSDPARAGPAAAYLGALISLLVAYQATNAIHFALNWLIAGAALGLTVVPLGAPESTDSTESPEPAMSPVTAST